ncbi:hypothetical protein B0I35DRAFT_188017 [Stachybotrys elegans]|uniref:Uncharacterized protein n=1 Tax=Stachybotrys elegans TaxID=80388 RepID=A0A8K0SXA1_9HYPO|nr:hypothetical protein B0I35DRAFT_188017 [Stachybotrys elegans]
MLTLQTAMIVLTVDPTTLSMQEDCSVHPWFMDSPWRVFLFGVCYSSSFFLLPALHDDDIYDHFLFIFSLAFGLGVRRINRPACAPKMMDKKLEDHLFGKTGKPKDHTREKGKRRKGFLQDY